MHQCQTVNTLGQGQDHGMVPLFVLSGLVMIFIVINVLFLEEAKFRIVKNVPV